MEFLILFILIALNGVFAMAEIAMVSSRRVRLEQAAERGSLGAKAAIALMDSPTRFLSTVQIGITIIGIGAGAFGEAMFSNDLAALLNRFPIIEPYGKAAATAIVVLGITYLSLVVGELVPKRIALSHPEPIAVAMSPMMHVLSRIAAPFVFLLSLSTDLLVRLFPAKVADTATVTEDEVRSLIRKGAASGVFLEKERELVERLFRLADQRVGALMVPRTDIAWLEADASADRIRVAVATSSFSHFPVCKGGLDNLIGVVHLKDMIKAGLLTKSIDLQIVARPPLFVPESMFTLRLLEEFRRSQLHVAFVLDEYGVLTGMITLNDLIEALLGQMTRHGEEIEPLAIQRPDGSWLIDGSLPVAELKAIMGVRRLPGEERTSFHTVAGFIMTYLGRVPRTGATFNYDRFQFEVLDMDRHRIDKVLLSFLIPDRGER